MQTHTIQDRLGWEITPELYQTIRALWIRHSKAEETHKGQWAGMAPTGKTVRLQIIIQFPWDPKSQKFAGERIYFDRGALDEQFRSA